jgi:hypothetical protein
VTVHPGLPPGAPDDLVHLQLDMWCPDCGPLSASATFGGMAAFHPGGLAFWQEHGRISTRPPQRTTFEQTDAILVDLVSNSTSSTLTYIFSPNGEQVLAIIPDA